MRGATKLFKNGSKEQDIIVITALKRGMSLIIFYQIFIDKNIKRCYMSILLITKKDVILKQINRGGFYDMAERNEDNI